MRVTPLVAAVGTASTLGGIAYGTYVGLVTGRITAAYAGGRPRAMQEKVHILGRTDHMVLAAHHTCVGKRLTAVTVETESERRTRRASPDHAVRDREDIARLSGAV